jgi:hypothetical protein
MECATGVLTVPMGAGWKWATLADSACSHHIPSLAPAVALPAPRHDRRRTGAAGSPPGGFPFVELTSRGREMQCPGRSAAQAKRSGALQTRDRHKLGEPQSVSVFIGVAQNSVHSRPRLREGELQRESRPRLGPRFRGDERRESILRHTKQFTHVPAGFAGHRELALLQDAALAGFTAAGISGA